ncbi:hypothetical protein LQ327_08980 [Actinomycetospora endophytica]|uniref:SET domain-containing protein n=1 Tax=Actinomycetospora endophytica TaxID=2291215 RepID=A0ABS8P5I3_9PSEU|nr:hypothetical protein [Actinomycetospora endophytica]MCD2193515.1 hypothetical protein [Actinomycetospora endophytica]
MSTPIPWASPSFITVDELRAGAFSEVVEFYANNLDYLDEVVITASQDIEDRCDRRFLPFTDLVETHTAEGIDPDGLGFADSDLGPLGLEGSLALSQARAYGYQGLVRDVWLRQHAPRRVDLWAYTAVSVRIDRPWGDFTVLPTDAWTGPTLDTGHMRFRIGTLIPQGSEITVTYSGGYVNGMPHTLKQAARLEAIKRLIREVDPSARPNESTDALEADVVEALAGYARY